MAEKTKDNKMNEHHLPPEAREHFHAARQEMRKALEGIVPPDLREHRRKAHREMLLGWRSMIDNVLNRMEEKEKNA
jgi:hypothetical protein